ncbi:hypothetical protein V6N13_140462 [Hibiscus sabdariffa]
MCAMTRGPWGIFFSSLIWPYWKHENAFNFQSLPMDATSLLGVGIYWVKLYDSMAANHSGLNTDETVSIGSGVASIGDMLRDHQRLALHFLLLQDHW